MAKRISVLVGLSETMRAGGAPVWMTRPKSSCSAAECDAGAGERQAAAARTAHAMIRAGLPTTLTLLILGGGNTKGIPPLKEDARNVEPQLVRQFAATRSSPEELFMWHERESSPGSGPQRSPSRPRLRDQWLTDERA
jgi:hypothetical protein